MGALDIERVGYWYFRLNGYLTIPNFIIHPDQGRNQETDVDIIAVRFPHRAENLASPMVDDQLICSDKIRTRLILAECKTSLCALNGPWTRRERGNMERVLSAIGMFPRDRNKQVAEHLYETGAYRDPQYHASLCCIGSATSAEVETHFQDVPQITWAHVFEFIFQRFKTYNRQKRAHPQWDETGKKLWDLAMDSQDSAHFQRQAMGRA